VGQIERVAINILPSPRDHCLLLLNPATSYAPTLASIVCRTSIAAHSITDIFFFISADARTDCISLNMRRRHRQSCVLRWTLSCTRVDARDVGSKQRTLTQAISNEPGLVLNQSVIFVNVSVSGTAVQVNKVPR
jgi:hypothetical protein